MLPREIVRRLDESGPYLEPKLARAILALGRGAIKPLRTVLSRDGEGRGARGYADAHAVGLLIAIAGAEAIPDVVVLLRRIDPIEARYSRAVVGLRALGAAVVEPLLAEPPGSEDFEAARSEILSHAGVRDPRIYQRLIEEFEATRSPFAAGSLAVYGDAAALPALVQALDGVDEPDLKEREMHLREIVYAIEELGGTLTPVQRARYEDLRRTVL